MSCHDVLEYDEIRILSQLGHDVFSTGGYINPRSPHSSMRPGLELDFNKSLFDKCQYFVCEFHEGPDNNLKEFDKWVYNTFNEKYDIKIPNWGQVDVLNPNNAIINYIIKLK